MYTNSSATYLTEEEMARRDKHVDKIIQQSKWVALGLIAFGVYYFYKEAPPLSLLLQEPKILAASLLVVVILTICYLLMLAKWKKKKSDDMKVSYEAIAKRPYRSGTKGNNGILLLRDGKTEYIKEEMFVGDEVIIKARHLKQGDAVRVTVTEQYELVLDIEKINAAPLPAYDL